MGIIDLAQAEDTESLMSPTGYRTIVGIHAITLALIPYWVHLTQLRTHDSKNEKTQGPEKV
jgi:hypothetical protein